MTTDVARRMPLATSCLIEMARPKGLVLYPAELRARMRWLGAIGAGKAGVAFV
jgi:hypothetical protein